MKDILEYEEEVAQKQPTVVVIGVGNSGFKQLLEIEKQFSAFKGPMGIDPSKYLLLSMNTDSGKWDSRKDSEIYSFQIGRFLRGQGTGVNIELGEQAYEEQREVFENLMMRLRIKFGITTFVCGGGTGTAAGPAVIESLHRLGIIQFPIVGLASRKHREIRSWQSEKIQHKLDKIRRLGIRVFQPLNEKAADMGNLRVQDAWNKMMPSMAYVPILLVKFLQELPNPNMDLDLNDVRRVAKGVNFLHAGGVVNCDDLDPKDIAARLLRNDFYSFGENSAGAILMLGGPNWVNEREYALLDALEHGIDPEGKQETFLIKPARCSVENATNDYAFLLRSDYHQGDEFVLPQSAWWVEGRDGELPQQLSLKSRSTKEEPIARSLTSIAMAQDLEVQQASEVQDEKSVPTPVEIVANATEATPVDPEKLKVVSAMTELQERMISFLNGQPSPARDQMQMMVLLVPAKFYDDRLSETVNSENIMHQWNVRLFELCVPVARYPAEITIVSAKNQKEWITKSTSLAKIANLLRSYTVSEEDLPAVETRKMLLTEFGDDFVRSYFAPKALVATVGLDDIPELEGISMEEDVVEAPAVSTSEVDGKLADGDKGTGGDILSRSKSFIKKHLHAPQPPTAGH